MQMVKTVSMAFHPCHKPGRMSVEVYGSRTMVIGPTFRERWQRRVECPEGGLEVAAVLLLTHHQIQHSVGQGERGGSPPPHPPRGGPNLPGLFTEISVAAPVTGRGLPG